jgi:hypothetical protein
MRSHHLRPAALAIGPLVLALEIATGRPAYAAWPNSPNVNLPVCAAAGNQQVPVAVSDGSAGAIVTWQDLRAGNYDIFAQHVLASGVTDPAWLPAGAVVCNVTDDQRFPAICRDGGTGAIIAWIDHRSGTSYDIYAEHLLVNGTLDPTWPANGRAVCTVAGDQLAPMLVTDGAGGAFIAWTDYRSANTAVVCQHVKANGQIDNLWTTTGVFVTSGVTGAQYLGGIVSDGAGSFAVVWQDTRTDPAGDIYAQHMSPLGFVAPGWPTAGLAVCTTTGGQLPPVCVADGLGGVIVGWADQRGADDDIYASRFLLGSATVDPSWSPNGTVVCNATGHQENEAIATDGQGGAYLAWYDQRNGIFNGDIFAGHVLQNGTTDPNFPLNGVPVCVDPQIQTGVTIVDDGNLGAYVAWEDERSPAGDVYMAHLLGLASIDTRWPANGLPVSTASGTQVANALVSDGAGGVIAVWPDTRNGGTSNYDIYAQRVEMFGHLGNPEPVSLGVKDVPNDNGGHVKVSWTASYLDPLPYSRITSYWVLRAVPPNLVAEALKRGARVVSSPAEMSATRRTILRTAVAGISYNWELAAATPSLHVSSYSLVVPTTSDSIGAGNPRTFFTIVARDTIRNEWWFSAPDSGYSVDNLPPVIPSPFLGAYSGGATHLHWNPNLESDLAGYRVYRGSSATFTPSSANQIGAPADTGFTDTGPAGSWYKLSAIDVHGNQSGFATLGPGGTSSVGGLAPSQLTLQSVRPNPVRASELSVSFSLGSIGVARIDLLDVAGRRVASREVGSLGPGSHSISLGGDRSLAPGVYVVRLSEGPNVQTTRVSVLQ